MLQYQNFGFYFLDQCIPISIVSYVALCISTLKNIFLLKASRLNQTAKALHDSKPTENPWTTEMDEVGLTALIP